MKPELAVSRNYSGLRELKTSVQSLNTLVAGLFDAINKTFQTQTFLGDGALLIAADADSPYTFVLSTPVAEARLTQTFVAKGDGIEAEVVLWKKVFGPNEEQTWSKAWQFYQPLYGNPYVMVDDQVQEMDLNGFRARETIFLLGLTFVVRLLEA